MIVSVVSMPEGLVTHTDAAEARARLATSAFVLVDVELPEEAAPDEEPLASQLGLDAVRYAWFGRKDEPVRAEYQGDRATFVVPMYLEDRVAHVHVLVTERYLVTTHRGRVEPLENLTSQMREERPDDAVAVLFRTTHELRKEDPAKRLNIGVGGVNHLFTHLHRVGCRTPGLFDLERRRRRTHFVEFDREPPRTLVFSPLRPLDSQPPNALGRSDLLRLLQFP